MNPLFNIPLLTKSSMLLAVVLFAAIIAPSSLASPGGHYSLYSQDEEVVVSPTSFSYDDTITVTLRGLPRGFTLPPESVTLGDEVVHIPGFSGDRQARLASDDHGNLTFSTTVPDKVQTGPQYLTVYINNIFDSRTAVTVNPIPLRVSSTIVVPNQDVWVMARGFKARPDKNKPAYTIDEVQPNGVTNGVTIGDQRVLAPYVNFPAKLGADGSAFFKLTVPEFESTLTPGQVELRVTDSEGRVGTAELTVPNSTLSFIPTSSYPGQSIAFSLTGLTASNPILNAINHVDLEYRYALDSSGVRFAATPIGRYTSDGMGTISGTIDVPRPARLSSTNYIQVMPTHGDDRSFAHAVAGPAVKIEPTSGFPGHSVFITLSGMPANYKLGQGSVLLGGKPIVVSDDHGPLVSDDIGRLTFNGIVPLGTPTGLNVLVWEVPGRAKVKATFDVKEGTLNFDPSPAVLGQVLKVVSGGFVGTFVGQGVAQSSIRISGSGDSWVWLDGAKLRRNEIDYPIQVNKNGPFAFNVKLPADASTAAKSTLELVAVDTAGRTSRGTLPLKPTAITVAPSETARKAEITVKGTGYIANTIGSGQTYKVLIDYAGIPVGTARLDSEGAFNHRFTVPSSVGIRSTNRVTALVKGIPSIKAHSTHSVSDSVVTVFPTSAAPGEDIKITGSGLVAYRQVTVQIENLWISASPIIYTDDVGAFEMVVTVPDGLIPGTATIKAYVPYPTLSERASFLVERN